MFQILFSLSSLLTTMLMSGIAIVMLTIATNNKWFKYRIPITLCKIFIILIIFRLFLPIEFQATITMPSKRILPFIYSIWNAEIFFVNISLKNVLFALWVTISLIKLLHTLLKYRRFSTTLHCLPVTTEYNELIENVIGKKKSKKIQVGVMSGIDSPVVVGILRHTIILPDMSFMNAEAEYILLHELQHLKQNDLWLKGFSELLAIFYWWNPIIHLLNKQSRLTFEICTDLAVTKDFTEIERINYLQCLLKMAKYKNKKCKGRFSLAFNKENSSTLMKRFNMVLNYPTAKQPKKVMLVNIIIGCSVILLSYSIVFEPYIITDEVAEESFEINAKNSYFLETEDGFELYVDKNYIGTLSSEELCEFSNIQIYKGDVAK